MDFNLSKFVKKVGQGIVINKGKKLMRGNVQGTVDRTVQSI